MSAEFWRQSGETITQLIAFVIFFQILKWAAWKPFLALLADRQKQIGDGFAEIERKQAEATKLLADHTARMRDIDQEARAKIQEAVNDGRRVAAEVVEAARAESAKITERAQKTIEMEIAKARVELRNTVVSMTIEASEKLLKQKLDEEGNRRLIGSFIDDMERGMAGDRRS